MFQIKFSNIKNTSDSILVSDIHVNYNIVRIIQYTYNKASDIPIIILERCSHLMSPIES